MIINTDNMSVGGQMELESALRHYVVAQREMTAALNAPTADGYHDLAAAEDGFAVARAGYLIGALRWVVFEQSDLIPAADADALAAINAADGEQRVELFDLSARRGADERLIAALHAQLAQKN